MTHVDRYTTHAVSLIINIAQGNLEEPWPVEVFDHANRLHEIIMEPGDIIYYESAKNLHSRNRPLLGGSNAYYVNLFTHYRPMDDGDDWYLKKDTKPKQPPVLDVQGECKKPPPGKISEQLGTVQCNDVRLGPYVSPSLFQANSGKDLFEWWRQTSLSQQEEGEENKTNVMKEQQQNKDEKKTRMNNSDEL